MYLILEHYENEVTAVGAVKELTEDSIKKVIDKYMKEIGDYHHKFDSMYPSMHGNYHVVTYEGDPGTLASYFYVVEVKEDFMGITMYDDFQ